MKKRIVKLTESDLESLVKRIIKEEDQESSDFNTDKVGSTGQKKVEKITDKGIFTQFKKYLGNKPAEQQVELVLTFLNELQLEQDFYTRFKRRLLKEK